MVFGDKLYFCKPPPPFALEAKLYFKNYFNILYTGNPF